MTRVSNGSMLWAGLAVLATFAGCGEHPADKAQYRQPTAAEVDTLVQAVAPAVDRSTTNVRVVNLPGGAQRAEINGGFQNAVIARANPDGTVSTACVDSTEQAKAFLLAAPGSSKKEVR
jgi:hypothetical protein